MTEEQYEQLEKRIDNCERAIIAVAVFISDHNQGSLANTLIKMLEDFAEARDSLNGKRLVGGEIFRR
jgi:hypothetical protein